MCIICSNSIRCIICKSIQNQYMIYVRNNCDDANDMVCDISPHPIATNKLLLAIIFGIYPHTIITNQVNNTLPPFISQCANLQLRE